MYHGNRIHLIDERNNKKYVLARQNMDWHL